AIVHCISEQAHHHAQRDGIPDQTGAQQMSLLSRQIVLGGVADQAAWVVHFVHDGVAGIDTGGTTDAFDLQAIADVDAGRAYLHTHGAVDAVTKPHGFVVSVFLARATLLAAAWIVGDDQRVLVEHHALEARIRTHVDAYLLAQIAGAAVG